MKLLFLFIISCNSVLAIADNFSETHKAKLDKLEKVSYADLAHENKGCPENSICSPESAQKFSHWDNFIQALSKTPKESWTPKLNKYLYEYGLPVNFLASEDDAKKIPGAFWSSRCRHHNLLNQKKIYKGITFLKESKTTPDIKLDEVTILETKEIYHLPYQHGPIMIWNNQMVFTLEFDSVIFHVGVSSEGKWKVVDIPSKEINLAINEIQRISCERQFRATKWHTELICKKIWNNKMQATQTLAMSWSCP